MCLVLAYVGERMAKSKLAGKQKVKKPSNRQVNSELEKLAELVFDEYQRHLTTGGAK